MCRIVASITRTAPRHRTCIAATTEFVFGATRIGTQSATPTKQARDAVVINASPQTNASPRCFGVSTTSAPCTCRCRQINCGSRSSVCASRRRFSYTASGLSPTLNDRFRLWNGPVLTPPIRVVNPCRTLGIVDSNGDCQSGIPTLRSSTRNLFFFVLVIFAVVVRKG